MSHESPATERPQTLSDHVGDQLEGPLPPGPAVKLEQVGPTPDGLHEFLPWPGGRLTTTGLSPLWVLPINSVLPLHQ